MNKHERLNLMREAGKKLIALRGAKTREEVAGACEVSLSAITHYELGYRIPKDEVKQRLAKYYGVNVGWLFYGEGKKE